MIADNLLCSSPFEPLGGCLTISNPLSDPSQIFFSSRWHWCLRILPIHAKKCCNLYPKNGKMVAKLESLLLFYHLSHLGGCLDYVCVWPYSGPAVTLFRSGRSCASIIVHPLTSPFALLPSRLTGFVPMVPGPFRKNRCP